MDQKEKNAELRARMSERNEEEIDLLEVAQLLWHRIGLLIFMLVLGAALAIVGTKLFITPKYTAQSTIYVFSSEGDSTSTQDLQLSNQLTADFQILATTRETVEQVIDQMGVNMTYEELTAQAKITVTNPTSSHMLRIKVEHEDPRMAAEISNNLADVLRQQIADIMSREKPSFVERAVVPSSPSSPSVKKNAAIGALALFVIAVAVILIRYFADDTITTEEDVRKYLGLTVLAAVPMERTHTKRRA